MTTWVLLLTIVAPRHAPVMYRTDGFATLEQCEVAGVSVEAEYHGMMVRFACVPQTAVPKP